MIIRVAALDDAELIAALVSDLGYPSAPAQVRKRLAAMSRDRATLAVVAEDDSVVTGLATAHALTTVHTDQLVVLLTALVVVEAARRKGVGRALVTHVEEWAAFQGARRLTVVAGTQRLDSHRFYERLGYAHTGLRYVRELK